MKYLRAVAFWLIGIMNTVMIKEDDIGTWKHYIGYILLLLALLDTIILLTVLLKEPGHERTKFFFLKVLALTIPFYVVYFTQLQKDIDNPRVRTLWKYIVAGFLIYFFGIIVYNYSN